MKPMAPTPESPLQERHRQRDQRAQHRGRGGEGRDDRADQAQQQGSQHRRAEAGDAVADKVDRAHLLEHEDVGADARDQHDLGPGHLADGALLQVRRDQRQDEADGDRDEADVEIEGQREHRQQHDARRASGSGSRASRSSGRRPAPRTTEAHLLPGLHRDLLAQRLGLRVAVGLHARSAAQRCRRAARPATARRRARAAPAACGHPVTKNSSMRDGEIDGEAGRRRWTAR